MIILRGEKNEQERGFREIENHQAHTSRLRCGVSYKRRRRSFVKMMMMPGRWCCGEDDEMIDCCTWQKQCTKRNVLITKVEWIKQARREEISPGPSENIKLQGRPGWKQSRTGIKVMKIIFMLNLARTPYTKKARARAQRGSYTLKTQPGLNGWALRCVWNLLEY